MQALCGPQVLPLLRERVRQAREAAHLHPDRIVLALYVAGANLRGIGIAHDWYHTLDITVSTHQTETMRTTVTLDIDVYEAALHLSRSSGDRLGRVLSTLARRGMTASRRPARSASRRFPTFKVAPGAPIIPATRIQRILDEEGLF